MKRKPIYYEGMAIREDGGNVWIFKVEDELYKNDLKAYLDYKCGNIYPGMKFEISEEMLDASRKI